MAEEIEVTPEGGTHSKIKGMFHLIPPVAIKRCAEVLAGGFEKYEPRELPNTLSANWRKISRQDHINHAIAHIYEYLEGKFLDEDVLAHACVRLMFAMETCFNRADRTRGIDTIKKMSQDLGGEFSGGAFSGSIFSNARAKV